MEGAGEEEKTMTTFNEISDRQVRGAVETAMVKPLLTKYALSKLSITCPGSSTAVLGFLIIRSKSGFYQDQAVNLVLEDE